MQLKNITTDKFNGYNDIKGFRSYFISELDKALKISGYKYIKTRETFITHKNHDIFQISVYMYKRPTFIEIETHAYYGNKKIELDLKNINIKPSSDILVGGNIKFIYEYYFKQPYPERYSNLIYMLNDNPDGLIKKWLHYYEYCLKVFLNEMSDPASLNAIVNKDDLESVGLSASAELRFLKFYFVGKNAGLTEDKLQALFERYEKHLATCNLALLEKLTQLKQVIYGKSTSNSP